MKATTLACRSLHGGCSPRLPGVEIVSQHYAPIIEAVERQRKRLARGGEELIRPRKLCQRCGAKLPVWVNGKGPIRPENPAD